MKKLQRKDTIPTKIHCLVLTGDSHTALRSICPSGVACFKIHSAAQSLREQSTYITCSNSNFSFHWALHHHYFLFLLSEVVSAEPFHKPVPKPRSKALDKLVDLDVMHKNTVLEVSQTVERQRTSSDDWHSASLSLTHDDHQCVSGQRSPDETHCNDTPPASTDSQGDSEDGNFNSKPLKTLVVLH